MVMPLGAVKWKCTDCQWSKVVYQKSDVLVKSHCQKCGSEKLEMIKPNVVDRLLSLANT